MEKELIQPAPGLLNASPKVLRELLVADMQSKKTASRHVRCTLHHGPWMAQQC
jgi:hypothetical protein